MRISKLFLIGLMSIVFVWGGIALVTPPTKEAEAFLSGSLSFGCDKPPTWKGVIRGKRRFVPTFVDKAGVAHGYCDRQTGVVLQGTPGVPPDANCGNTDTCNWDDARFYCANLTVGGNGQKGWRLLSMPELASLVDNNSTLCNSGGPCLPDGHPFSNVQSAFYWSASTSASNPTDGWLVGFLVGTVSTGGKTSDNHAWCGRGAMAADAY